MIWRMRIIDYVSFGRRRHVCYAGQKRVRSGRQANKHQESNADVYIMDMPEKKSEMKMTNADNKTN